MTFIQILQRNPIMGQLTLSNIWTVHFLYIRFKACVGGVQRRAEVVHKNFQGGEDLSHPIQTGAKVHLQRQCLGGPCTSSTPNTFPSSARQTGHVLESSAMSHLTLVIPTCR